MMINKDFWKKKRVLITGNTGFKGSWLSLWLNYLGAKVTGYSLEPPTRPSLFKLCEIEKITNTIIGDIRDIKILQKAIYDTKPEIIFHLAAQPLVLASYSNTLDTYSINVMGTVNLLEVVRRSKGIRVFINVTSDKCYENKEWVWGYRENDTLGGLDPYSNSKACSELITTSYRYSFFHPENYEKHKVAIATVRAGNVIGGGDWAKNRLIPDCMRAILNGKKIIIRNPEAVRPWQHVLEPLSGYIMLAEKLYTNGSEFSEAWNFGPDDDGVKTVEWIVRKICEKWGKNVSYEIRRVKQPYEASYLKLDCSKSKVKLGWKPKWNIEIAIDKIIEWIRAYKMRVNIREASLIQIDEYLSK